MIFALGFALEKVAAMQEHGIKGTPFLPDNMKVTFILPSIFQGNLGTSWLLFKSQFLPRLSGLIV